VQYKDMGWGVALVVVLLLGLLWWAILRSKEEPAPIQASGDAFDTPISVTLGGR
jgi:hypothetical protein